MSAGLYDLYIEKGTTFTYEVFDIEDDDGNAIDLTGYSARMMVRDRATDDDSLVDWTANLTVSPTSIVLELTDAETSALDFDQGVYDLEIESAGGEVTRLLEGTVTCSPEVTR